VVTFVGPSGARAASAGTFILYASHVATMAPGTNLGAATPVAIGGLPVPGLEDERRERARGGEKADGQAKNGDAKDGETKDGAARRSPPLAPKSTMETKVLNDAIAYIRALAELRDRNADWAEQAVREGASLSSREAEQRKVIDYVAANIADALTKAHGRVVTVNDAKVTIDTSNLTVEHFEPDWRNRLLAALANPNVALILMMIGIYGLLFEFMHPGAVAPGTIGAICLLIGLYALQALPINYAGLALIVLGLALMVAEAFTPSFGVLGIGGAISFVLGATILIDTDLPGIEVSLTVVGGLAAAALAFSALVLRLAFAARRRAVASGAEEMIGTLAVVQDWSGTAGHVFTHGERWRATADQPLAPNEQVRVAEIDGLTLKVSPAPDAHSR
jgi:membrane-bound serine protease (ClpP class)